MVQKYLPLDLRPKKTRAIRRRLTKHQVLLIPASEIHLARTALGHLYLVRKVLY